MNVRLPLTLTVTKRNLLAVARAVVHTIIFHRAVKERKVVDVHLDFVDVTYPRVVDASVEQEVNSVLRNFVRDLEASSETTGKVIIYFAPEQGWRGQVSAWETWTITFNVVPESPLINRAMERDLIAAMHSIVANICAAPDVMPHVKDSPPFPFPYKITFETQQRLLNKLSSLRSLFSAGPPNIA